MLCLMIRINRCALSLLSSRLAIPFSYLTVGLTSLQQVVTNCLYALQEIMADDGGMAVSQSMILKLLSRIEIFSEWGICQVGLKCVLCADEMMK